MENNLQSEEFTTITLTLKIKANLDKRITQHVRSLKHIEGKSYSKNRWIQEAIKEKLKTFDSENLEKIESDCNLKVIISGHMHDEIMKIVHILKTLNVRSSKTDFVLEAIEEKLNLEEKNTKEILHNMLKNTSKAKEPFAT